MLTYIEENNSTVFKCRHQYLVFRFVFLFCLIFLQNIQPLHCSYKKTNTMNTASFVIIIIVLHHMYIVHTTHAALHVGVFPLWTLEKHSFTKEALNSYLQHTKRSAIHEAFSLMRNTWQLQIIHQTQIGHIGPGHAAKTTNNDQGWWGRKIFTSHFNLPGITKISLFMLRLVVFDLYFNHGTKTQY